MTIVLFGATAAPAEDEMSVSVTSDFFSKYIWRGQNVTDDWVWQPGASISYKGLTGGFWGNLDLTDENDESGQFIEYDYYVDYSAQINDTVGFSVGGIYYYFPGSDATTELYWGFSFDVPASPAITVYHDIDEIDGTYAAFSVGHSFENPGDLPFGVDLGASLGWGDSSYNDEYWSTDTIEVDSEFNDLTLTVGFPFEVGGLSVTPSLAYVALLGSDVRDAADDDSIFYAGVGLAYEF
jgi:uncharacterized protein (TIGR02001 family)